MQPDRAGLFGFSRKERFLKAKRYWKEELILKREKKEQIFKREWNFKRGGRQRGRAGANKIRPRPSL